MSRQPVSGPTTLCLNGERFRFEVEWRDFADRTGVGQAVPLTGDTGYFWFFSSNNVELVIKVLWLAMHNYYWTEWTAHCDVPAPTGSFHVCYAARNWRFDPPFLLKSYDAAIGALRESTVIALLHAPR